MPMKMNSRQLAQRWPFPRHKVFEGVLRKAASVWFAEKGFSTHHKMSYCLKKCEDWKNNIILEEVARYIEQYKNGCEAQGKPFPLHKYAHHGLSSQAMAFNLIGPLITRNDYAPLQETLSKQNISSVSEIASALFEYEDRSVFNEDSGQPTSIDIVLKDSSGIPIIFIESKLVEQEFGGCSVFLDGDCDGKNPLSDKERCYLHYIGRKYWKLIEKYGISNSLRYERQCVLVSHYQFFRELLFSLEKGGVLVLLSDERSPVFHCKTDGVQRGLMPFLIEFVPEQLKNRISSISIQSLVENIKKSNRHNDWIEEFEKKYGLTKRCT